MTVCVVGHGTSPVGKGWGSKIDACETVVRLWNWHWMDRKDWGIEYTWGFYELSETEVVRFFKHNCRFPHRGWIGAVMEHKPYYGQLQPSTWVANFFWLEQMGRALGGVGTKGRLRLTRGVRAAAWIMDRMGPGQELILVGFDNAYAGTGLSVEQAFPEAYRSCPAMFPLRGYTGGSTKYGNHDYAVERPLLEEVARQRRVELLWSQEVWDELGKRVS